MQLTKQEDDSEAGKDKEASKKSPEKEADNGLLRNRTSNEQAAGVGGGIVSIES